MSTIVRAPSPSPNPQSVTPPTGPQQPSSGLPAESPTGPAANPDAVTAPPLGSFPPAPPAAPWTQAALAMPQPGHHRRLPSVAEVPNTGGADVRAMAEAATSRLSASTQLYAPMLNSGADKATVSAGSETATGAFVNPAGAAVGTTLPQGNSIGLAAYRAGVGVDANVARDTSVGAFAHTGFLGLGADTAAGPGALGVSVGGYTGSGGFGGSYVVDLSEVFGLELLPTVGAFGYLYLSADSSVENCGEYTGTDERLKGKVLLKVSKNAGHGEVLSAAAGMGYLGIGGRLHLDKSKQVVFSTFLEPRKVAEVALDAETSVGFFTRKAIGLGLKKPPIEIPDLSDPSRMQVGDTMVVNATGTINRGLVLGSVGVRAGVYTSLQGEFEIALRKVDDNIVDLVVSPRKIKAGKLGADIPILADASVDASLARSLRQSFRFDLRTTGAREAYQLALGGDLPGDMPNEPRVVDPNDDVRVPAYINAEHLPDGVQRLSIELVDLPSKSAGYGCMKPFFFNWGPEGAGGLSNRNTDAIEHRVVASETAAITSDTHMRRHQKERLHRGIATHDTEASTHRLTELDPDHDPHRRFGGLVLRQRFDLTRAKGAARNQVIKRLNEAFALGLRDFQLNGHGQSYQVVVERTLDSSDLDRLARATPRDVTQAAASTGARRDRLSDMCEKVANVPSRKLPREERSISEEATRLRNLGVSDAEIARYCELTRLADTNRASALQFQLDLDRAKEVANMLPEGGIETFGAVHRLLGGGEAKLRVRVESSSFTEPLKHARAVLLRYPESIKTDESTAGVNERFADADRVMQEIDQGLEDLFDDPVVTRFDPEGRAVIRHDLLATRRKIQNVESVSHFDPDVQRRIIRQIWNPTLAQQTDKLCAQYITPIMDYVGIEPIFGRFASVEKVLGGIERELERTPIEPVGNVIVDEMRRDKRQALINDRARLEALLSFSHLRRDECGSLIQRLCDRKWRHHRLQPKIVGRLEQARMDGNGAGARVRDLNERAELLAARYPAPIRKDEAIGSLTERFDDADALLAEVEALARTLARVPRRDDFVEQQISDLLVTRGQIDRLKSFKHLDRAERVALRDKIKYELTKTRHWEILDQLDALVGRYDSLAEPEKKR